MPESIKARRDIHETCSTVDMIALAEAMANCAYIDPEFYDWANLHDHVESMVVNIIARIQLDFTPEFEKKLLEYYHEYGQDAEKQLQAGRIYDGVCIAVVKPNDCFGSDSASPPFCLVGCCQYSGMRALYTGWCNAMTFNEGELRINYFMNKRMDQAVMQTAIPNRGEADISLNSNARVFLRIPSWLKVNDMTTEVNRQTVTAENNLDETGHYLDLGQLEKGAKIQVSIPLVEQVTKERIIDSEYTVRWRGNYVVKMNPPGLYHPIFP
jgi:DUF1680 family protein